MVCFFKLAFDGSMQVVKEVIDPTATIEYKENTADDPHKRKPDITKAKDLLGWEPKIPLRQGLPKMVEDFRKRIFGDHKETKQGFVGKDSIEVGTS